MPVPRLSREEVAELVRIGERETGLTFAAAVVSLIEEIAQGSPYFVRLACYHSSLIALSHGRLNVVAADVSEGLEQMVAEAAARLPHRALQRVNRLRTDEPLLAIVVDLAGTPSGWFSVPDIYERTADPALHDAVQAYIGTQLIPAGLMEEEISEGETRFRFVDESLQSFFWIALARDKMSNASPAA
jgi:hypothetical protein